MDLQPNIIEIKRVDTSTRVNGVILVGFGVLVLLASRKIHPLISGFDTVKTVASLIVWTLLLAGGLGLIRLGFSFLAGPSGLAFYCERRELVHWSRTFFLNKRYKTYSFEAFDSITIREERRPAFPVSRIVFCVHLTGAKSQVEIVALPQQSDAMNIAERLSSCCNLPVKR